MTSKSFNIHVISGSEDGLSLTLLALNVTSFNKETVSFQGMGETWTFRSYLIIFHKEVLFVIPLLSNHQWMNRTSR